MPKLAKTLTDVAVRNYRPKDKPYKVAAGRGLHLLVKPDSTKFWVFRYRFEGKENSLSMGRYPDVSLANAEERVRASHKSISEGKDPSEKRKDAKAKKLASQANIFSLWADKWWQHWHKDKSPRHADYVKRRIDADINPSIGNLPINEIEAYLVVKTIKAIAERGALDIAKRAHQTIGQVFRYAIAHSNESQVKRNPASDVKPSDIIESRPKTNYARVELKELPQLLRDIEISKSQPLTRLAIKLMTLTFVRTTELIEAKWSEFDLDEQQWRIPAERMKMRTPHIVPLSRQAIQVLEQLKTISGHYALVFPNQNKHSRPMSNNTILKALEIAGYKGRMTGHGFRGLASTALHEQGFDHQHIELQLAHQERNQVSAAYNHALYLKQRTNMMQQWADYLDELKAGAKVIKLSKSS